MRVSRRLFAAALLGLIVPVLPGCGDKVYNGSDSFYDQHPEYKDNRPDYMNRPTDDDPHAGRPW